LEETTIKNLVVKNCQHISHPIYLWNTKEHWQLINFWLHNQEKDKIFIAQRLMNHLPNDLIFSILSKLCLKSLKRFGCLQRSWTLLFENSHFMNLFHNNFICNNHSSYDDTSLLLSLTIDRTTLYSVSDERFQNMEKIDWPNSFQEDYSALCSIVGSYSINGIICIYSHVGETMYLWNPTNNEFKVIPPSPFEPLQYGIPLNRNCQGFGYDSVRDDYKVIKHVSLNDAFTIEDFYDPKYATIVEMYSLRRNSWKKLEHDIDLPVCYDDIDKFYFEGMCHWLGYPYELAEAYLVSFDLSNEVFIITKTPLDIPEEIFYNSQADYKWRHLLILNGSIAFMLNFERTIYLYILVEVGKKETWTKLHVFGPIPCIAYPIGTWNMGNILFNTPDDDELVWFNLCTHKIEKLNFKVNFHVTCSMGLQLVVYKESLVRINS